MSIKVLLLTFIASLSTSAVAFMVPTIGSVPIASRTALSAVIEIGSEVAFDKKIKSSGNALVIVDYSTTWCGPCKGACFPKYLTLQHTNAINPSF
jgi:thioredoxin 1